ncbi:MULTISPECIES: hypothetical protein [Catenuloplanes]|uniref:Uncharacterized protein n=1 Tax=Catenuloplanes niger TaxID=587534 RepID=A0AAE3ZK13_9ACTN|nr:hypothetical protein [Catenuloplanes niger]MDR7321364.1 hypothetical protein [Catenuloplanes niger]
MLPYYLYLTTVPPRDRIAAALAAAGGVPASAVDLADTATTERNWRAAVLGTLHPVAGDLRLCVEVWFGDGARVPSEPETAAALARTLDTPVAYPAVEHRPSAYRMALADGRHTRIRVYEQDEPPADGEPVRLDVDATEHPIPALPRVPVMPLPEVIHDHPLPSGCDVPELRSWDHLVVRVESGWPPDGWYPAELYASFLAARDAVDAAALDDPARAALAALDARFRSRTVDDGGAALRARLAEARIPGLDWARPPTVGTAWWWRRITLPPPWARQPGG